MDASFTSSELDVLRAKLERFPELGQIFDACWFGDAHAKADAGKMFRIPLVLNLARNACSGVSPQWEEQLCRVHNAISVVRSRFSSDSYTNFVSRVCHAEQEQSVVDELLAIHGFAVEFGNDSIQSPPQGRAERKPEFLVAVDGVRIGVECVSLRGSKASDRFDAGLISEGQGLSFSRMGNLTFLEPRRLQKALGKKFSRNQAGSAGVLIAICHARWMRPDRMRRVIEQCRLYHLRQFPSIPLPWCVCMQSRWACHDTVFLREEFDDASVEAELRSRTERAFLRGFKVG